MKKITIHSEASISARGKFNSKHCTPIMFLKLDGSEMHSFTSVADASEALNITASYISTCLNNEKNPVCKGYIVFRTKDAPTYIGQIMHYFNSNAGDARNYQRIKAEEEAVRKAKELRQQAIAKAETKVTKCADTAAKYESKWREAMNALDVANQELEKLLEEQNGGDVNENKNT